MTHDPQHLVSQVRGSGTGWVRAAARLMSLTENHPERIPEFLIGVADWPVAQMVVGVTGPPGCGKSVLTDRLVTAWRKRDPLGRIGVIAVDPSSPFTGGAFLGDRLRMMRHAGDPQVFIRSAATRGHIGGLILGVHGFIRVLGLAGCRIVVIESVGVGQNELEIAEVADLVVVTIAPGNGDAIQLLKCGLMEVGDIFAVNSADRPDAEQLYAQLLAVLHLTTRTHRDAPPPQACLLSALYGSGVETLVDLIEARAAAYADSWQTRRRQQVIEEVKEAVLEEARHRVREALGATHQESAQLTRILRGEISVAGFVDELLRKLTDANR